VLNIQTSDRRILHRAGGMECVMDGAKALEGVWVEGVVAAVAEAGAIAAALPRAWPAIRYPMWTK
jgi:hypothetical protein